MNNRTPAVVTAIFLLTLSSIARADQPAHGVEIIKQAWSLGPCLHHGSSPFQAENDSFRPTEAKGEEWESESSTRVLGSVTFPTAAEYYYTVKVKNAGWKVITEIVWDYVFSNPGTGAEMDRHTFRSEVDLMPGRTKSLSESSPKPPTRVIDVSMLTGAKQENYLERVEIKRVAYKDGTVWEAKAL